MSKIIPFLNGPFSQWHMAKMTIDDVDYNCCEQYMMAEKARLFGDQETLNKILSAKTPKEQKNLGRLVSGFDEKVWKKNRYQIVCKGNLAKFSQNEGIRKKLLDTGDATLCEAAHYDPIWGVGLRASDPRIKDPKKWKGLNLLGQALMYVRQELQNDHDEQVEEGE